MNRIPIEEKGWELNPETCPCDLDFIEFAKNFPYARFLTIFHMGPGMHHSVGKWAASSEKRAFVFSISITPEEIQEYIRLITEHPVWATRYWVQFMDIHLMRSPLLPRFDLITLFHLGEIIATEKDSDYPGTSVSEILRMFSDRVVAGGSMLFFPRSVAWKKIESDVDWILRSEREWKRDIFKNLLVYTRPED